MVNMFSLLILLTLFSVVNAQNNMEHQIDETKQNLNNMEHQIDETKQNLNKCKLRDLHEDAVSCIGRAKTQNCKELIQNISCLISQGKLYPNKLPNNCNLPQTEYNFDYVKKNTSNKTNITIRILFLLQIHGRAVQQVLRLLRAIYHINHYYYIHVDSRDNYMYYTLLAMTNKYDNIILTSWRYPTMWGGANLLDMIFRAMEDGLDYINWNWDYFINLSGMDFPIKTNNELVSLLATHYRSNFVRWDSNNNTFINKQALDKTFIQCDDHMWRIGPRSLPTGAIFLGGSDWIVLHRNFIKYVLTTQDALVVGLKIVYKYTLLPVESFFHTVLRNSKFCSSIVNHNLRIIGWKRKIGCNCQYRDIVDWCGCSPNNFRAKDIKRLLEQPEQVIFARKFESIVDNAIVNLLESYLYNTNSEPDYNIYFESIYDSQHSTLNFDVIKILTQLIKNSVSLLRLDYHSLLLFDSKIKEIFIVNKNDKKIGLIIETLTIQFYMEYVRNLSLNSEIMPKRFIDMRVGVKWEMKENIFRNYHNILTIWDNLSLQIILRQGEALNITVRWFDPNGIEKLNKSMFIESTWTVAFHIATSIGSPLEPGLWSTSIETDEAAVPFAILSYIVHSTSNNDINFIDKQMTSYLFPRFACQLSTTLFFNSRLEICKYTIWSNLAMQLINI